MKDKKETGRLPTEKAGLMPAGGRIYVLLYLQLFQKENSSALSTEEFSFMVSLCFLIHFLHYNINKVINQYLSFNLH